jgi:hypothetical protein
VDYLVGVYTEEEKTSLYKIDMTAASAFVDFHKVARRVGSSRPLPPNYHSSEVNEWEGSTTKLSETLIARLVALYKTDHPDAALVRIERLQRAGMFSLHFSTEAPCVFAKRLHSSEGNTPYLLYDSNKPYVARYKCHSCSE